MQNQQIHATGICLAEHGILLRGPSGAGKSVLALALLDRTEGRGQFCALVSDDRVNIELQGGHPVMQAPPAIAGMIELRGRGIVVRQVCHSAPIHLVIDLVPDTPRMLEDDDLHTELLGVRIARCPVPQAGKISLGHQVLLVAEALRVL